MIETPFPHLIMDDFVPLELCRAAVAEWPDEKWPYWLKYEGTKGDKLVTRDSLRLTPACQEIIREMARIPLEKLMKISDSFPDLTLYGAGMAQINAGGELPRHLDSDHNSITGWQRAASAMLYLTTCGGGHLCLLGADTHLIEPKPGRLVIFECGNNAWHSVAKVLDGRRLSLSLFFWKLGPSTARERPHAQFVP